MQCDRPSNCLALPQNTIADGVWCAPTTHRTSQWIVRGRQGYSWSIEMIKESAQSARNHWAAAPRAERRARDSNPR